MSGHSEKTINWKGIGGTVFKWVIGIGIIGLPVMGIKGCVEDGWKEHADEATVENFIKEDVTITKGDTSYSIDSADSILVQEKGESDKYYNYKYNTFSASGHGMISFDNLRSTETPEKILKIGCRIAKIANASFAEVQLIDPEENKESADKLNERGDAVKSFAQNHCEVN